MLSLGDQSESDAESQLQDNYFNQLQGVLKTTPLFTIAGNHEATDGEVTYKTTFSLPTQAEAGGYPSGTKDYYSFNFGNVHVVGLTAENSVSISGAQKTWLANDLANNKSDWLIAFMHHPMHSAGNRSTNDAIALAERTHWLPLLEGAGADLVLSGHNHVFERSYLVDNLTGNSSSITDANKIDTTLCRTDAGGAYQKVLGQPHQGTIFVSCAAGGDANKGSYQLVPHDFFPVVFKGDLFEGSLVVDIDGRDRMDVTFLCDETGFLGTNIWDHFTIMKKPEATAVSQNDHVLPGQFSITNYPNPFNPSTKISYSVPQTGHAHIAVYDLLGSNVATLADEVRERGVHTLQWSGKGKHGNDLSGGVYVAQLRAGGFVKNTKMMLLR